MRLRIFFVLLAFAACLSTAQEPRKSGSPKIELFGGFSYASTHVITLHLPYATSPVSSTTSTSSLSMTAIPERMGLSGWNAALTVRLPYRFGIVTDFAGNYSNASRSASSTIAISPGGTTIFNETITYTVSQPRTYTLLAGPEFRLPTRKLESAIHFLAGSRIPRYDAQVQYTLTLPNSTSSHGFSRSYSPDPQWAIAVGGDVERPIRRNLAWRAGCDYLTNRGADQNHVRAIAGLVWKLGR
jgi:hypothetical protein